MSIKLTSHHLLSTLLVNTVCNLGRECFKPSDSQTSQAAKMKTGMGIEIECWSNQDMRTGIWMRIGIEIEQLRWRHRSLAAETHPPALPGSGKEKKFEQNFSEILLQGLTKIADLSVCSNITVLYLYSNKITRIGWLSVIKKIFTNKQKQTHKQNHAILFQTL